MNTAIPARLHHCFAVPDLERSMDYFTEQTGVAFQPVRQLAMTVVGPATTETVEVNFTFSVDGRLELVQTVRGNGLFSDETARGFHHIGYQVPAALAVTIEEMTSSGEKLIAEVFLGDTPIAVFFAPTAARPVRLEILSPSLGNSARTE